MPTRIGRVITEAGNVVLAGRRLMDAMTKHAHEIQVIEPIQHGVVHDWNALSDLLYVSMLFILYNTSKMEKRLTSRAYLLTQELGVSRTSNDKPLFISIPQCWSLDNCEELTRICFENLNCPYVVLAPSPTLALFASSKDDSSSAALVVDIGHGKTEITPIFDNVVVDSACQVLDVGGRDIEDHLFQLLEKDDAFIASLQGRTFTRDFAREIKESACIAGTERAMQTMNYKTFEVGSVSISIGTPRGQCVNALFDPSVVGKSSMGLAEGIATCLELVDHAQRKALCESVIVCGGGSSFKHFWTLMTERMRVYLGTTEFAMLPNELQQAKIPGYFSKIKDSSPRIAFIGAQLMAQIVMRPGERHYMTKQEYAAKGPALCHEKILF